MTLTWFTKSEERAHVKEVNEPDFWGRASMCGALGMRRPESVLFTMSNIEPEQPRESSPGREHYMNICPPSQSEVWENQQEGRIDEVRRLVNQLRDSVYL